MIPVVRVIHVKADSPQGYAWQWVSADGRHCSKQSFDLFYDCVENARRNGHVVELGKPDSNVCPTSHV